MKINNTSLSFQISVLFRILIEDFYQQNKANTCYVCKRIKESKGDFTKKRIKRLKKVKDLIKHKGCQKSARIKKMPLLRKTYTFFKTHKANFIFYITNKSIILFRTVVSFSSKNTNNPSVVYIKYDVNNTYVTFLVSFPFPFISIFL